MIETIEEWAERVAPTLDAEKWRACEVDAAKFHEDERRTNEEHARALLAVRDRVVSNIGPHVGKWLTEHAELLSDFGRECARVLREGK